MLDSLARSIVRCGAPAVLGWAAPVWAATGADALRFPDNQFRYQRAATWAKAILAIVDAAGVPVSVDLLRTAAERCQQVGEIKEANASASARCRCSVKARKRTPSRAPPRC